MMPLPSSLASPPEISSDSAFGLSWRALPAVPRSGDGISSYRSTVGSTVGGTSRWSSLRFRRDKDKVGWVLLGIPLGLYSLVVQRLFEERAKFIAKYRRGSFVDLRFEAPQSLAATLAITFPAPPGSEPLVINAKGDRILSGSSSRSDKSRLQTIALD